MPPNARKSERPQIWAEGRQSPPFDVRAFALASVLYARGSLSGLLQRCAVSAAGFGQVVATGRWRVPPQRLGRTGRFLPSVEATARAISAGSVVLSRAALAVEEAAAAPEPSIFAEAPPLPRAPTRADDPDLAAIRALIDDPKAPPPHRPAPTPQTGWRRDWLANKAGAVLGYGLLILSVPVGAVLATLAHLNGEDLRKLVDDR